MPRPPAKAFAAPPSKSLAHRAVLCAALAAGPSQLENLSFSQDISATLAAAGQLCALVSSGPHRARVEGVEGGERGRTLRFLIPRASLSGQAVTFTGRGRLMERPQSVYEAVFAQQGLRLEHIPQGLVVEGVCPAGPAAGAYPPRACGGRGAALRPV